MLVYLVLGAVAYFLLTQKSGKNLLGSFRPNEKMIENDLLELRSGLQKTMPELIPYGEEELRLLSFKQQKKATSKMVATTARGVFTTIYDEPLLAYGLKKYPTSSQNIIVAAYTSAVELQYHFLPNETQIRIGGQAFGILKPDGGLYPLKGGAARARVGKTSASDVSAPIFIGERLVGSMTLEGQSKKLNPRVFEAALPSLTQEEESVLLALAIPYLLGAFLK